MRTVTIESESSGRHEIGTNESDGGLFHRRKDGTWGQFAGNGQTPTFQRPSHLMAYLRRRHYVEPIKMIRGSASGW